MATLMQRGAGILATKFQGTSASRPTGRSVTFKRGPLSTSGIVGWGAMQDYAISGDDGMPTAVTSFDWTFKASEVVIAGSTVLPRAGDRIVESLNGVDTTYETMPIETRPCVEWLDSDGILLLVHTKKIASAVTR